MFEAMDKPNTKVADSMAIKIFALKLTDQLLYTLGKHPNPLEIYSRQKLVKMSNYGYAVWADSAKGSVGKIVKEFLEG